jgi:predicted RNA-binding protein YlqC (UPF0109 family)
MANESTPAPQAAAPAPNLEALVVAMAKAITDHPDEVEVESFEDEGVMVAELAVALEDLGKVIGRQGRTVRSMRTILEAASEKMDLPWELDIVEDDEDDDFDDAAEGEATA